MQYGVPLQGCFFYMSFRLMRFLSPFLARLSPRFSLHLKDTKTFEFEESNESGVARGGALPGLVKERKDSSTWPRRSGLCVQ